MALREPQRVLSGVLSGAVQFFKEESSSPPVGGQGRGAASKAEEKITGHTGQHADL